MRDDDCRDDQLSAPARAILLLAAAILTLTGCATLWQKDAASTEELLAAAGFQRQPADTPERLADLESMPRQKLVDRSKDANVVYTYADPDRCHCFYVGGPEECSAYGRLTLSKVIVADGSAGDGLRWLFPWSWR
jgi:hypothetical protein